MRHCVVYEAAPIPERINEDSYYFFEDENQILMMVADGATPRLKLTAAESLFKTYGPRINGASYASRLLRSTISDGVFENPEDILLKANERLKKSLEEIYGELSADAILKLEPHLPYLADDERMLRLTLPVAVATVVKLDLNNRKLYFAHAGDTALFLMRSTGETVRLTDDQMEQHDMKALVAAGEVRSKKRLDHLSETLDDEEVKKANLKNGLYHNFVDEHGQVDKSLGVAVVNGLDQLQAYMQVGDIDVGDGLGILLMSDGAILPAPYQENLKQEQERFQHMGQMIKRDGLSRYLDELRKIEASDRYLDQYPRFKVHDDATAIYLEL